MNTRKGLAVGAICLLMLVTIPIAQADTDHFSDSVALIVGNCNTVSKTGLWIFGLTYIHNKEVTIQAQGEDGEKIHVLIFPPKFAFHFSLENIKIQMEEAKGIFFWGGKSLLFNNASQRVFAICKAGDIWLTY